MGFGPYGHPYGPGNVPTRTKIVNKPNKVLQHDDFPENQLEAKEESEEERVKTAEARTFTLIHIHVELNHGDIRLAISPEEARIVLGALRKALAEVEE